jgi:hypothetical protein
VGLFFEKHPTRIYFIIYFNALKNKPLKQVTTGLAIQPLGFWMKNIGLA